MQVYHQGKHNSNTCADMHAAATCNYMRMQTVPDFFTHVQTHKSNPWLVVKTCTAIQKTCWAMQQQRLWLTWCVPTLDFGGGWVCCCCCCCFCCWWSYCMSCWSCCCFWMVPLLLLLLLLLLDVADLLLRQHHLLRQIVVVLLLPVACHSNPGAATSPDSQRCSNACCSNAA
jgi:hypothetical protein